MENETDQIWGLSAVPRHHLTAGDVYSATDNPNASDNRESKGEMSTAVD